MTGNRLSIKEAAALMNVSEQFIRVGMQRNLLPFGFAIKHKSKWCYYISPAKFTEATGIEVNVDTEESKEGGTKIND